MQAKITQWVHHQWQKKGILTRLLYPLSLITQTVVRHRQKCLPAPWPQPMPPIIVVGNILVGGAGKTPIVIHLCQQLQLLGWTPGVISRGYGIDVGSQPIAGRAPLAAQQVGDEPAMIAAQTQVPIAVHPQRRLAAQALLEFAPKTDIIISDDGLQHYDLPRDVEIIVEDERGIGNGWLLPAGPLREPAARRHNVDWLITHQSTPPTPHDRQIRQHTTSNTAMQTANSKAKKIIMWLQPTELEHLQTKQRLPIDAWQRQHRGACQAMAGIGQPQRFFTMLQGLGFTLARSKALADHAPILQTDVEQLGPEPILITAKDAIKIKHGPLADDPRFWVVHVNPCFSPSDWVNIISTQLSRVKTQ